MTRKDLIGEVAREADLPKSLVEKVVKKIFDGRDGVIVGAMRGGEVVKISGFGKFSLRERDAIERNHPRTGLQLIPARKYPKFESSRTLREVVRHG